jgi:hypothetical protein
MNDKQGRAYAHMSELTAGDRVTVDGDFTCLRPWSQHSVEQDEHGLFVRCDGPDGERPAGSEKHYLDGQLAEHGDALVGVYPGVTLPPRNWIG